MNEIICITCKKRLEKEESERIALYEIIKEAKEIIKKSVFLSEEDLNKASEFLSKYAKK